jgi:hypothetical protein
MSKPLEDLGSGRASGKVPGHRADPLASARNAALDPLPPSVASHQVRRERAGDASCLDRVGRIHELEVQMGAVELPVHRAMCIVPWGVSCG